MEDLTGKQLGQYQIVAPLGEGGMAAVYKAFQPSVERYVALKVLPRYYATDPNFVRRFKQEARIIASLEHPHILAVHDFGEQDGHTYIVMRCVEGKTLADLLKGKPLPLAQIDKVISQVADALDYAHGRGVVHRDVKPSNVMIDAQGHCLLSDFGLARILSASSSLTTSGAFIGTPAYASPEQCLGQEDLDRRSDVYSLGVMLYEMATGRQPFKAETPMAVVIKHVHEPLPNPGHVNPALPASIERVILKALAKEREQRYPTAGELARAVAAAVAEAEQVSSPSVASPPGAGHLAARSQKASRKLPAWVWMGGGAVAAALLCGAVVLGLLLSGVLDHRAKPAEASPTRVAAIAAGTLPPDSARPTPLEQPHPSDTLRPLPTDTLRPQLTITPEPLPTDTLQPLPTDTPAPLPADVPTAPVVITQVSARDGAVMVFVPASEFLMGSADADIAAVNNEKPQHRVYVDAFWIDQTEVTNARYARCVQARACQPPTKTRSYNRESYYGDPQFDDYPVVYVRWADAQAYCSWAGRRLPSEAEWEKAARGSQGWTFPWGMEFDGSRVNFCDVNCLFEGANKSYDDGSLETAPAVSYLNGVSPYGALNMSGNVWEWVADWFDENYYRTSPAANPGGPQTGQYRVLRGGSFHADINLVRAAFRSWGDLTVSYDKLGFRCALTP